MTGCPDDELLARYCSGALTPTQRLEIDRHLEACAQCEALVAAGVDAEGATVSGTLNAAPSTLEPGSVFGRYTILSIVGQGGFGRVYAAYDERLDRRVALKVLSGSVGTSVEKEAQALAQLSHPNVVTVFDAGVHEGVVFVAMELNRGRSLAAWLASQRPTWTKTRAVLVAAGRGIEAAHRASIIHCDIKPANVLVGDDGRTQVVDFGLALRGSTPASEARKELVGTPGYVAPEMLDGRSPNAATDQYAFGVMAFRAFFHAKPFKGRDLIAVARQAKRGPPDVPRGVVPEGLRKAIARMLHPDPAQRFTSMTEAIEALTIDQRTRRKSGWALGLGILGVGASLGLFWPRAAPSQAERARIEALAADVRDAADRQCFVYPPSHEPTALTALRLILQLESTDGPAAALADAEAAALREELSRILVALGDEHWDDAQTRGFARDFYVAASLFEPDDARARERSGLTPGQFTQFQQQAEAGDFSSAQLSTAAILKVLAAPADVKPDRWQDLVDADPPPPASSMQALVTTQRQAKPPQPESDGAEDHLPPTPEPTPATSETVDIIEAPDHSKESADPAEAAREVARGRTAFDALRLTEAERHFHRALKLDARAHAAHFGLGEVAFERGRHAKATTHVRRAVALSPKNAYRLFLGDLYLKESRYDAAQQVWQAAAARGSKKARQRLENLRAKLGD